MPNYYDDLKRAGDSFTGSFGSNFKELGVSLDKFLDFDGLKATFMPVTDQAQEQRGPGFDATPTASQQGSTFNASPTAQQQQQSWAPSWNNSKGTEISGRFAAPGGGYAGLETLFGKLDADIFAKKGALGQGATGASGPVGSVSPEVDQWDNYVQDASSRFGTPANLLKSVMESESGGVHRGANGQVLVNGAGAIGLMQIVGEYHQGDAARLGLDLYDEHDNIAYASYYLNQNYQQCGNWEGAVNAYYTGSCTTTGRGDDPAEGGSGVSDSTYTNTIIQRWHALDGTSQRNTGGTSGSTSLASFTGGMSFPITQELGLTDFAKGQLSGQYAYSAAYGVTGHAGIDIGMPRGTSVTSPFAGQVVCVGGSSYGPDQGGGGCGAFKDTDGNGVGRVQIRLANGDHVIFGHMSSTNLRPGDMVSAGQVVGASGGSNGAHLHLEYRKRTPGATDSGFTAVDVRTMSGAAGGTAQGTSFDLGQNTFGGNIWGGSGYNPAKRRSVYYNNG